MRPQAYTATPPETSPSFDDSSSAQATVGDAVRAEKDAALKEPGPSWRVWFFQNALRWYYALGVLVMNVQILVFWIEFGSAAGLAATLVAACYGQFLLYRYLWYRPHPEAPRGRKFHRTWHRPWEYGRWTPEADLARAGLLPGPDEGPTAREFL